MRFCSFSVQKSRNFSGRKILKNGNGSREKNFPISSKTPASQAKFWMYVMWSRRILRIFYKRGPSYLAMCKYGQKRRKWQKKPQKWQKSPNLSILYKILGKKLHFDQFWAHSANKKLIFRTFEIFRDFTIVKWWISKSGPFRWIWTLKTWSGDSIIC